jgi:ribosomal protein S27E
VNAPALPALTPHGVGTSFVESLTSYICRSAAETLVPAPRLLRAVAGVAGAFRYTQAVNGTELITARIISEFASWSGVPSLDRLGFAKPGLGLHLRKDFRRERAWCPVCLASPRTTYDQVSWSFAAVGRCPRDGATLQTTCARCGQSHRVWDLWAHPLRCANCGADLGDTTRARAEVDARSAAVASVIAWVQSGRPVEPRRIATWARTYRGNAALRSTGRRLGLTQWTLSNIAAGTRRLQMDTLVSLITQSPTKMNELHSFPPVEVAAGRTTRHGPARVDTDRLSRLVCAELALPVGARRTVAQLAGDLGVHHVTLRRHCRDTDRLIHERREAVQRRRAM